MFNFNSTSSDLQRRKEHDRFCDSDRVKYTRRLLSMIELQTTSPFPLYTTTEPPRRSLRL